MKLIRWFMTAEPPTAPFQLYQGVYIADPELWCRDIQNDITAGPNHARGQTGALKYDLRRLHKLFAEGMAA